jgi:hypothetical protein
MYTQFLSKELKGSDHLTYSQDGRDKECIQNGEEITWQIEKERGEQR